MRKYALPVVLAAVVALSVVFLAGSRLRHSGAPIEPISTMESVVPADAQALRPLRVNAAAAPLAASGKAAARTSTAAAPQIARTGKLTLFVADAGAAVAALSSIARRRGGDVFSLQLASASAANPASAQMQLRVPADQFDTTMNAAARTGKVREQSESAQDLTGDINDSAAQLQNLRRTEDDMRHIMDRSGSVEQILDVENQLSDVRQQIQTLEASLKTMREQVVYSTIDVSLSAETTVAPVEPPPASQLATALHAAWHAFSQSVVSLAAGVVWVLVFTPYVAVLAVLAFIAARRLRPARP